MAETLDDKPTRLAFMGKGKRPVVPKETIHHTKKKPVKAKGTTIHRGKGEDIFGKPLKIKKGEMKLGHTGKEIF